MDKNIRIDEIVTRLNAASDAYYGGQEEQMTNYEWDALFDELTALEKATGYVRPDSPTQVTSHSGNEMDGEGEKEAHEYPALSLAKTKKVEELQDWAGERDIWLSWKLDGSTLVATYDGGALTRVLTRGNGTVGTNITYMASAIRGIPAKISDKGHLVVRGEATISYADFEAINDTLEDADDRYANPRNLAAGTLALDKTNLDKVKERNVTFNAFTLVHTDEVIRSWGARMDYLEKLGFITVEREHTDAKNLPDAIARWTKKVDSGEMGIPVDGLVITYDDTDYAATGSVTTTSNGHARPRPSRRLRCSTLCSSRERPSRAQASATSASSSASASARTARPNFASSRPTRSSRSASRSSGPRAAMKSRRPVPSAARRPRCVSVPSAA